jgi:hypothetical protein
LLLYSFSCEWQMATWDVAQSCLTDHDSVASCLPTAGPTSMAAERAGTLERRQPRCTRASTMDPSLCGRSSQAPFLGSGGNYGRISVLGQVCAVGARAFARAQFRRSAALRIPSHRDHILQQYLPSYRAPKLPRCVSVHQTRVLRREQNTNACRINLALKLKRPR